MKIRYKMQILSWISVFSAISLTGCSRLLSSQPPAGSIPMKKAYEQALVGADSTDILSSARLQVHSLQPQTHSRYHRALSSESLKLNTHFRRVPNPDIVLYVYPHRVKAGKGFIPIPAYTTVFPLYQEVHYAIDGQ